ncbi:hypothetical protein D6R50_12020 [Aeromonas veronii]|uniref:Uncharacterized protein n=1 Tax=Aeromonas veronii TaxID=654 RepID=A0A3A9ITY4_AERVE|nr:hypothetical protein [Aeromonas veronii]RKJ89942.1 hypothetical protein D6R50_12020 [Aeromonas veronii]
MTQPFKTMGGVPPGIEAKAVTRLACAKPRKLKYIGGEVIDVGLRYRLYRAAGAACFSLMTHERYSHLTSKKKRRG